MKDKLGCLLVQLPPKFGFHDETVRDFFLRLQDRFGCMIACEGRHPSWFSAEAEALLIEVRVARGKGNKERVSCPWDRGSGAPCTAT